MSFHCIFNNIDQFYVLQIFVPFAFVFWKQAMRKAWKALWYISFFTFEELYLLNDSLQINFSD